jgi:hypothetical protein
MITVLVYCENIIIVTYICTPKYYIFTNAIYSTAKMWNKMKSKKYHSRNIFKKSDRKSVKESIRYLRLYSEYNLISPNRYGREEICNQTRPDFVTSLFVINELYSTWTTLSSGRFMVFNATFNNISVISLRGVF